MGYVENYRSKAYSIGADNEGINMIFGLFGGDKKRVAEMIAASRSGDTVKLQQLLTKGADINAPEPDSGDTPILAAIDKGQWSAAEFLLKQRPDLSLQDKNGNSPLYLAVSRGDAVLPMVKLLLDAGANTELVPTQGDNAGATPVHIACAIGANGCLESLLRHGAAVTKQLPDGSSPMHTAAIGGDQRTVLILSAAGADVNALNQKKRTPLHHCGIAGNFIVATELIRLGAEVDPRDKEDCTPLMHAVMENQAKVATVLLDNQADPNVMAQTDSTSLFPLHVAVMHGRDDMITLLIEKGADVSKKVDGGHSLVEVAKHSGHESSAKVISAALKRKQAAEKEAKGSAKETEAVWYKAVLAITQRDSDSLRKLISAKHYSTLPVDSQLLVACVLGDNEMTRSLLQAGANPKKSFVDVLDGITPLVAAVGLSRSLTVAQLLLDAGADANQDWGDSTTPIFETTADQFFDLAKLLVSKGANVNASLNNGFTPLIYAARNGAANCVDLFLDAGADINAVESEHAIGAFGWALNRLDLKLAEHLLERGAVPNFGSIETLPLAIAEHGSLAFVRALEEKGCKLVPDDQRGRMAFISARNPDPEVFDYFLNHGADPSQGNDFGYTPLILASLNNRTSLIRRYLERGDDASARDIDGETALSLALEKRNNEAVALLREFHVEEKDFSALVPDAAMLKAAKSGALGTILNLRDEGVFINSEDDEGNTPILLAVKAGHLGVVRSLYHLGADINHRNQKGETALAVAKISNSTDIVNSLQEFGALDAMDGELGKLSGMFGGIAVFNAADTMSGRMSHPYKDKPPYDNPEFDGEDESDESEEFTDPHAEEDTDSDSVESKLDLLGQALDSDQVKEQLPEAVLEQFVQKLDHWRSMNEESEFDEDELAELNRILGLFGLRKDDDEEEVVRTPLFEAVHRQDISAVKKIIKSGSDINEVDGEGNTALLIAVFTRQSKLVEELLKLGADPNQARPDGKGPLFGSVRVGEEKITQLLLKGGADVEAHFSVEHNGIPVGGCTALYIASSLGQLAFCRLLLSGGAELDAANDLGYTPLMAAIEGGHDDVIDFFLKSGANVNPDVNSRVHIEGMGGASPLITATRKEHVTLIKKLLKRGVDVNRPASNGWTPLKSAAQQGNSGIVKVLLDGGADPNIADDTNYTPLMNAVSGKHEGIVKLLLKYRADPNVQSGENPENDDWEPGRTALMDAAVSGNVPIARELLKQGANPNLLNSKGRTALHSAVISANTDMVSLLLKSGADPDIYGNDEERLSALDLALRRWASEDEDDREGGVSDVLALMIKKGMPTDRGTLNETALDLATEGNAGAIAFLRKQGFNVDPNQLMSNGASYLFILAGTGDDGLESAKLLLELGADPNYKSPAGLSVLSLAVRNGATKLAKALLVAGADVMARNNAGALAYDLAAIYGHDELAQILITQMNRVVPEVDKQDPTGDTALMRAVKESDTKAVSDLLSKCADASRRDLHGDTPLSFAVCRELDEVVHLLRQAGAERLPGDSANNGEKIVFAGAKGALGSILDLLDSGVSIDATDAKGDTALTKAEPHPGVVRVLAKMGADLSHRNQEGNTAYMIAAAATRTLMMQTLVEVGSPIDEPSELDGLSQMHAMLNSLRSKGSSDDASGSNTDADGESNAEELLMVSLMGDAVAVSSQIAAGVDVSHENDEGRTALMMALGGLGRSEMSRRRERDFEQIIDSLLVADADPDGGLMPPLILATLAGRLHIVNALIRAGADVNLSAELPTDEHEGTVLANALIVALLPNDHDAHVDERIALALVRAGIELSFTTDDGSMAVHCAAKAGMTKTLLEILDRAPESTDAQDNDGSTPLMLAAAGNRLETIGVLLNRHADREIRNAKGYSAAEIAASKAHQEAAAMLA